MMYIYVYLMKKSFLNKPKNKQSEEKNNKNPTKIKLD